MRRTSLTQDQANELAAMLRRRRSEIGYTIRQLASEAGVHLATIAGLERGEILTPQPDTLKALATALDISVTDMFAVADWLPNNELPTFRPYMRAKYQQLPAQAVEEMEAYFDRLTSQYGVDGPEDGEDET